ncbi:MAG: hypothetical protein HYX27_08190 [Acidobacteria bacterium]|nr:hypothetical protein [Acidobacteriota bacterium]
MKRRLLWLLPLVGAAVWMVAQNAAPAPSQLPYFPPGAMLALDARDFGQLLREWNGSQAKRDWLASDAYRQFAVSRLSQRLREAQQEFADAASASVDMDLVEQLAGDRTSLALYNPGDLEFLLVTRMPEARFAGSLLGRKRAALSPRNAAGTPYFVATTAGSRRAVAFSIRGEWLIAGTSEMLVAQCLQRMAANSNSGLTAEEWYARAAQAAGAPGELRMAANIDALYNSPHFRSYWIHRNRAELLPYLSTISDLDRQSAAWTERRVLVRKQAVSVNSVNAANWPPLLRAVPASAGLYRAWLQPDANYAAALLVQKFFDPMPGSRAVTELAPGAVSIGEAGEENAWDDRIDEAPFVPGDTRPDGTRLAQWLANQQLTGLVHIQGTRDSVDNVWIHQDTGLVFTRNGNWNAAEVQSQLAPLGAAPVQTAVDGNRLLLANTAALLTAMRADSANPAPAANVRFTGVFRHGSERTRFTRWMARIGQPTYTPPAQGQQREPQFLGDVIGSLSQTLRNVREQSVTAADTGDRLTQTIVYRMQ